jgi:hypothetical protein
LPEYLAPNIQPLGKVKLKASFKTMQFAQTIAYYFGIVFTPTHPAAASFYSYFAEEKSK